MDCSPEFVEDFEDLHNVDFMCPYCHEVVELFNNDLQFSIDMHSQNDTHITAYKNFQENNIARKDKPPDIVSRSLDRQKNNAFILDSIMKSVSVDIAPLNHTSFGNDNIHFLDTDTDLSKSLNDKLVLKESSCKLERLFMQLPTGFEYNIPYISMAGQKLFCYLCNCVIVTSLDEVVLCANLKKHLEGSHRQNYLKELIKLLPKEQVEDENYFILKLGHMMCKLCKAPIPIAFSGLKSTFYNVIIHLRGKKHKTNLNTNFEDYSGLKQLFDQKRPKTIKRNKFYLTKNGEYYKCVLCNKNISLSGQDVSQTRLKFFEHLNSNNHLNKVKIFENISPNLDYEYLKQKIYPLQSQIIEQNMKHIVKIDEKWFKCTLCAAQLEIFSEPSVTVSQFSQHLKSTKHKQNLKAANTENESSEKVNQVKQESSGNTHSKKCSNDDFDCLKTKLNGFPVPQIFDENKQFIIAYEKHFKCTLCKAILQVSPIPSITIENFTQHLQSKFHKKKKNKPNKKKKIDLMKIGNDFSWGKLIGDTKIPDIIEQNKQFVVKNKTFMCILCNTELKISSDPLDTRSIFAQHFHLPSHKRKKIEYEKRLAESIKPSEYFNQSKSVDMNPSTSTPNDEYGLLEEAFGSFYQLQLVQENKQFIIKLKEHFKCSLCDVQLAVTSDPETNILLFSQHLESVFHKQNKLDLENVSLRSSVNIALNSSSIDNEFEFLSLEAALGTHYQLEVIKHNAQYLIKEGNFFKCTLCDLQIQLSSEIALNVLRLLQHLKSEIHIQNRTEHVFKYLLQQAATAETANTLSTNFQKDYLYLKALLDPYPVPQSIEQNKKFIVKNGVHYKCTLCDSHLEVSFDPRFTRTNFALHLDCPSHEQKRIEYEKRLAQTTKSVENLNTNGNVDTNPNMTSNNDLGVLKKIFGIFHELKLIQENKQFIVKLKKHVKCSLCDVQLSLSTDHEKNILLFSQHLESVFHKQNNRDRRNNTVVNSVSIENELQFSSLEAALGTYYELMVIKHNTQYLIIEGNLFKCTLCNSQFSVSSEICINLLRLSLHLKSEVHKENRTEYVFTQLMQQTANSQNMNTPSNIDYLYLQALLDPYPIPQYVERNKQFIVKNGSNFKCILCNANIKVSTDPQSTIQELSAHFEIGFHNGKKVNHEKHLIQNASNITSGTQANSVNWPSSSFLNANKEDLRSLEAVLGTFPRVIDQNKQYIVKLGSHFKCVLCNEQLKVLSDPAKTVPQFTQHFHSVFHKQNRINHNIYLEAQSAKPVPQSPPTTSKQNTITQQEKDYLDLKILLGPYSNLSVIEQNKQFIVKDGNHFKCTLCDASISVSSDIATVSKKLMEHFEGKAHKKKEKMSEEQNKQSRNLKENHVQSERNLNNKTSLDKNKSDFSSLKAFLKPYPIPEIFEKNKDCIVRERGDFKCTLCNVSLKLLSDVSTTVQQFSQHLKGAKHKRLFKFRFAKVDVKLEKAMHSTLSAETNTDNEHPDYIYLKEILHPLKIPGIFEENKGYLVKKGNNFECILCDAQLSTSTVASKIVFEFSKHLNCANHKRNQRNFEAVKVNSKHLSQSGSNFECSLCKTKLGTTSNFQNMIQQCFQHFISVDHVKNVQALSNKKTNTSDKKPSQPSNISSNRSTDCTYKDVVSGLKEVLQVNVLPQIIVQNRDYIVKSGDHYLCSLCKAQLSVSPNASSTVNQFSQHLSSNRHSGKVAALKTTLPTASSETVSSKNPSNNTQHATSTPVQDEVSKSLKEIFYPYNIPHTIKVNLSHIRRMGDHYACVACGVQLSVTSRPYFTILNFVQHLGSKNHTSKFSKKLN